MVSTFPRASRSAFAFAGCLLAVQLMGVGQATAQRLVGRLTEQYVRVCKNYQESWIQPHFEAGFVWLMPQAELELKPWLGKAVILSGSAAPLPPEAVEPDPRECPQMQARSDFVFSKQGIRLKRRQPEGSQTARAFRVSNVRELTGLQVRKGPKDTVEVEYKNDMGQQLGDLVIILHYDGCYGKPMVATEERVFSDVAAGATVRASFPALLSKETRQASKWVEAGTYHHTPSSVQLASRDPQVIFELDLPMNLFTGLKFPCPPRK